MGKNDKSALGRALVKHHNHMIQESKEKGQVYYKQHKKVLESITDVNDIDAVIQQADETVRLFSADNPTAVATLIDLYKMIASGVLPIHRMTEHREAVQVVADRVPRHVIESVYNITLPKPKPYEPENRPPLAAELLRSYCASRGYVASSGLPDETKASRLILKDYIDGKLPHYEVPPGMVVEGGYGDAAAHDESNSSGEDEEEGEGGAKLEDVLDDLESFDMVNGLSSSQNGARGARKKVVASDGSHKHHKKPQRKKDRGWRVKDDGSDGMPVVRVYQKLVNTGPVMPA